MSGALQIYDARERWAVRIVDACLSPLRWFRRPVLAAAAPRRVLLLRLERIGDLLMILDAVSAVQSAWPEAEIDLAVGSWNAPLAECMQGIARVVIADVPWLARHEQGDTWSALLRKARSWRARQYDIVLNFEPDIRSNLLAWVIGAPRRVGYSSGGGGALLNEAGTYDASTHVSENALRLVARASGRSQPEPGPRPRFRIPDDARREARLLLGDCRRPIVAVHVSGGRPSKQWHPDRFAAVARAVAREREATIVLTGVASDRPAVGAALTALGDLPVIDACGRLSLLGLMGLLAECDALVTGDTGPMHLAAAIDTPVVALFGPSNPVRYGPRGDRHRVLRVDLPCSPCGRVRLPPQRCRGHVPDCLDGISTDAVIEATLAILDAPRRRSPEASI